MYAQKNYPQHMGNGQYTIAQTGCLLTAICNGLQRLNGSSPDPVTLNQYFIEHGLYGDAAPKDGWMDDLGWNSISQYDATVALAGVGSGSLPSSANAIVKFHYNGVHTGQPTDHFCWVDRIENGQVFIIDSYDGLVKPPSGYEGVYGKPIAWAVYVKHAPVATPAPAPVPVATPVPAPQGAYTVPAGRKYSLVVSVKGYNNATNAGNHQNPITDLAAGEYFIFNTYPGKSNLINLTKTDGKPGAWVNTVDNVVPSPVPTPETPPDLYRVLADIPGYNTSNDAANHINRDRTVNQGAYFIFNQVHGMVNVTVKPGTPGAWINPSENVAPAPAPAPVPVVVAEPPVAAAPVAEAPSIAVPMPDTPNWRSSYKAFAKPVLFVALKATDVEDVAGQRPRLTLAEGKGLKQFDRIWLSGSFTFVSEDGTTVEYLRCANRAGNDYWYSIVDAINGVPQNVVEPYEVTYDTSTTPQERVAMHTATIRDYVVLGQESFKKFLETIKGLVVKNKH